jgi:hypothetical protein
VCPGINEKTGAVTDEKRLYKLTMFNRQTRQSGADVQPVPHHRAMFTDPADAENGA